MMTMSNNLDTYVDAYKGDNPYDFDNEILLTCRIPDDRNLNLAAYLARMFFFRDKLYFG
jgi:hypothetical protein